MAPRASIISPLKDQVPELLIIENEANRVPWSESLFLQEFENRFSRLFAASIDGRLVGFLVVHLVLDEAHIVNLAVRPCWQGRGIGRSLMEEGLAKLQQEGAHWAYLEVRAGNVRAASLYESLGFFRVGLRRRYYCDNGEDAVLMNLDLSRFAERFPEERSASA